MSTQRQQLDTAIEREVHRLIKSISEGVYDGVQLYARRNNLPVDPEVLTHILKTVQIVISEHELKNIDKFHSNIKRNLDDYVGDELTTSPVIDPKKKKAAAVTSV
jgi:hypothetical protein